MFEGLLSNQVAIVTGASRGIGREIALELARAGAHLTINGNNVAKLEALRGEIEALGRRCEVVVGDVALPETGQHLAQRAKEAFGRIDILVNNAGINDRKSTLDMTLEDWRRVLDINLNGTLYASKAVLPVMVEQKSGAIVNITSANGKAPHPNAAPSYGASKAAVTYLTKHFALEFGKYHIRVNALQCGPVESDMTAQWTPEYRKSALEKIPLGKLGTPRDAAMGVLFLCSDMSSFITGASINMSGGKLME